MEILEIEERKNHHINELMKKHEKAAPISPHISPHLTTSHHISPHLPTSPHISLMKTHEKASGQIKNYCTPTLTAALTLTLTPDANP